MKELFNLNISDETLTEMIEKNNDILRLTDSQAQEKINILFEIGFTENEMINIISSNSKFLTSDSEDIISLFKYFNNIGLYDVSSLVDANPFILNIDTNEFSNFINKKIKEGNTLENILYVFETNPFLFSELFNI